VSNTEPIAFHEDEDLFREALEFSAAKTGFPARLVEKDYYCTLLLQYLTGSDAELIFKGGTCLAKVHASFYRLSEDLDFSIPMPVDASRAQRSARVQGLKSTIQQAEKELPNFKVHTPMTGANRSAQYSAILVYPSALVSEQDKVKIEVGLREPLLRATLYGEAQTLLLNPITESQMVPAIVVESLSWEEAMAEKLRAALTRREAAIRDFYDVYHAITNLDLSILSTELVELVRAKISVPGNDKIDMSSGRLEFLRAQEKSELEPVLRQVDFSNFNLEWTFSQVHRLANEIEQSQATDTLS
jgi:predicted nucleotidyltransferase component of viral defense system